MEETLKPLRGGRGHGHAHTHASDLFADLRQQAEAGVTTRPTNVDVMNMADVNAEFVKIEHGFGLGLDVNVNLSPGPSSHHSTSTPVTPVTPAHAAFGGFDMLGMGLDLNLGPDAGWTALDQPSHRRNGHRRTESVASIASAASIASLNVDEAKTETGVTLDDIAAHMRGPEGADAKWLCTYEGCGKRFGRKENIKSHVQTHLNDRQYQCPTCRKCFVRQHDLKRHAKIHTGIKPYPCDCGNSFARHDALTRHRQRGMCVGAFDGVVRKAVKRGRPRKHRPEDDASDNRVRRRRPARSSPAASLASTAPSPVSLDAVLAASASASASASTSTSICAPASSPSPSPFDLLDVTMHHDHDPHPPPPPHPHPHPHSYPLGLSSAAMPATSLGKSMASQHTHEHATPGTTFPAAPPRFFDLPEDLTNVPGDDPDDDGDMLLRAFTQHADHGLVQLDDDYEAVSMFTNPDHVFFGSAGP